MKIVWLNRPTLGQVTLEKKKKCKLSHTYVNPYRSSFLWNTASVDTDSTSNFQWVQILVWKSVFLTHTKMIFSPHKGYAKIYSQRTCFRLYFSPLFDLFYLFLNCSFPLIFVFPSFPFLLFYFSLLF